MLRALGGERAHGRGDPRAARAARRAHRAAARRHLALLSIARCAAKQSVLLEGAQGTLLDLDHGTYPFVTSSSASAAGACAGAGIGRPGSTRARHHQGLRDARGRGAVPDRAARRDRRALRKAGGEFGSVTGRPRRTGWLDLPALRYAARVNGLTASR